MSIAKHLVVIKRLHWSAGQHSGSIITCRANKTKTELACTSPSVHHGILLSQLSESKGHGFTSVKSSSGQQLHGDLEERGFKDTVLRLVDNIDNAAQRTCAMLGVLLQPESE